jgi:hypothetical protein
MQGVGIMYCSIPRFWGFDTSPPHIASTNNKGNQSQFFEICPNCKDEGLKWFGLSFFSGFFLIVTLSLGFFCYANDLLDDSDSLVALLQYPFIIYQYTKPVAIIHSVSTSHNLSVLDSLLNLLRSPPS